MEEEAGIRIRGVRKAWMRRVIYVGGLVEAVVEYDGRPDHVLVDGRR